MTTVIKAAFEMFEKDPETFYEETVADKMIKKRKKTFGIHELAPADTNEEVGPEEQEDVDGSESNKNTTYTVEGEGDMRNDNNEERMNEDEEELRYDFPPGTENTFPSDPMNLAEGHGSVQAEPAVPSGVNSHSSHSDPQSQTRRPHLEPNEDNGNPVYFELAGYLEGLAPAKKIRYNPGKGLCLEFAVGQQGGFDPEKLKMYRNKKMVEWYVFIKEFMTYPLHITVGSGNDSYQKTIHHQYELFTFLRSKESLPGKRNCWFCIVHALPVRRCRRAAWQTQWPLLTVLFSPLSFSLSASLLFSQKELT